MDTGKSNLLLDIGIPPTKVVVCIRVMPDIPLRPISQQEVEPLGYLVKAGKIGMDAAYWLVSSKDAVHAKSASDLAAKVTFQDIGVAIEPIRFELDSRWVRSSREIKNYAYWESLYFVDITVSEKNRIRLRDGGAALSFMTHQQLNSLLLYADRGHFLRLRYSHRFATKTAQVA